MEARFNEEWHPYNRRFLHPEDMEGIVPRSYSSSDSFMSLDESSMLSPTSSMSSHSETDGELWFSRSRLEQYEARLRSRERFQELVRRWESKQAQGDVEEGTASSSSSSQSAASSMSPSLETPIVNLREKLDQANPDRQFQELRKHWETRQISKCSFSPADVKGVSSSSKSHRRTVAFKSQH